MGALFNLKEYTPAGHVFFAAGCLLWAVSYIIVIKRAVKSKFVEIPILAVCCNFAWETLWSWCFITNMGPFYLWGYRIWFFLDIFIVYLIFRYGAKQLLLAALKKYFHLIFIFSLACCFLLLYYYIDIYDRPISHMGAYSGYIANILMSALYIPLLIGKGKTGAFSYLVAWCKGVGTFLITIFCFLKFSDPFLLSMCGVTTVLDATYIFIFTKNRKEYKGTD